MDRDEMFLAEQNEIEHAAIQFGKTLTNMQKTTKVLFLLTPTGTKIMPPADPKTAERAKRYIWSRIERNQANSGREE